MESSNRFPANPELDTACFRAAHQEWQLRNDLTIPFWELPLTERMSIMRRANEMKSESLKGAASPALFVSHIPTNEGQAPEFTR